MKRSLQILAFTAVTLVSRVVVGQPINVQPPYQASAMPGVVDPTAATFNSSHPMVACAVSCSAALVNQNTDALQAAANLAAGSSHPIVNIPPGEYPIFRGGAAHNQAYGVLLSGVTNVVFRGYGATLRMSGNAGGGKFSLIQVKSNSSRVRFFGLTFSQRDLTGTAEEHSHDLEFGDGSSKGDDFQIVDCSFVEGKAGAGDAVQLNGGSTQATALQRVTVAHSTVQSYGRTGLSFQHGTADMSFYENRFGPTPGGGRCSLGIHHEPTSGGKNVDENVLDNVFDCSDGSALTWSGWTTETTDFVIFAHNQCLNCSHLSRNTRGLWIEGNVLTSVNAGVLVGHLQGGTQDDTWIVKNFGKLVGSNLGSPVFDQLTTSDGIITGSWVDGNEIEDHDCLSTGNSLIKMQHAKFWVTDNQITYRSSTTNKCICVGSSSETSVGVASGWITGNLCKKGKLSDNVTSAGNISVGFDMSVGAYAHLGHGWVKDNVLDGGQKTLLMVYTVAQLDEGVPVVSGNRGIANTSGENEPAVLRTETTPDAESPSTSGALSPVKRWSYLATSSCGSDSHALADGLVDGIHKRVKVTSTCATDVTITPTHFGDGTSLHCPTTGPLPNCYVDMVWDAAGAKWWLIETDNFLVTP